MIKMIIDCYFISWKEQIGSSGGGAALPASVHVPCNSLIKSTSASASK